VVEVEVESIGRSRLGHVVALAKEDGQRLLLRHDNAAEEGVTRCTTTEESLSRKKIRDTRLTTGKIAME
jgi:hypothetical protein